MTALTHRVAVNAYLLFNKRFLLLKRTAPPLIWVPPGGRLNLNEDPVQGLLREVEEETGQVVEILAPVDTWFGKFHGSKLLSIDYLAIGNSSDVRLSSEHNAFLWLSIDELRRDQDSIFTYPDGFTLADFASAWQRFEQREG